MNRHGRCADCDSNGVTRVKGWVAPEERVMEELERMFRVEKK
jgi:hypothetical protein